MNQLQAFIDNDIAAQKAVDGAIKASERPRLLNPTCFLNREACRDFLLEHAAGTRAHKFERVSAETLTQLNESVRSIMISVVRRLPSKGKTI